MSAEIIRFPIVPISGFERLRRDIQARRAEVRAALARGKPIPSIHERADAIIRQFGPTAARDVFREMAAIEAAQGEIKT